MSKVLWEWNPNVESKARESAKATSLAFVLLDFQHAGVRRRALCTRQSTDMQQFRKVNRTRTIYSTESETHISHFIFNMFWNGKPVQFFQERCWVVVAGCQENESCSEVLNFLKRLDDRTRCTHEETVAAVKPWEDTINKVFKSAPAVTEIKVPSDENPALTKVLLLKPGEGQNIAMHALATARNFCRVLIYTFLVHSCLVFFSKLFLYF